MSAVQSTWDFSLPHTVHSYFPTRVLHSKRRTLAFVVSGSQDPMSCDIFTDIIAKQRHMPYMPDSNQGLCIQNLFKLISSFFKLKRGTQVFEAIINFPGALCAQPPRLRDLR